MSSQTAHRVVIAGGGVAAIEALLALRAATAEQAVDVTVVAPGEWLTDRPLAVREPFGDAPPRRYGLAEICADLGATLRHEVVTSVDAVQRVAVTGSGARLPYDSLATREAQRPDQPTPLAQERRAIAEEHLRQGPQLRR